jgi:hypothetical protein
MLVYAFVCPFSIQSTIIYFIHPFMRAFVHVLIGAGSAAAQGEQPATGGAERDDCRHRLLAPVTAPVRHLLD